MLNKHSGENQIAIFIALFKKYNIYKNIKYFIADSMELNNIY